MSLRNIGPTRRQLWCPLFYAGPVPDQITISLSDGQTVGARLYAAAPARRLRTTLVLAHGAGAGQTSPFMVHFAEGLMRNGIDVCTFNFPYAERNRRVPDRAPVLEDCFRNAIAAAAARTAFEGNAVFIGGKSMGGRIATHLGAHADAVRLGMAGLVLLGYPLHPPGKPQQLRAAHLPDIKMPALFIQGSRDPFGTPDELRPILATVPHAFLHVVENGDHSLAPPRKSASHPVDRVYDELHRLIADWMSGVVSGTAGVQV